MNSIYLLWSEGGSLVPWVFPTYGRLASHLDSLFDEWTTQPDSWGPLEVVYSHGQPTTLLLLNATLG